MTSDQIDHIINPWQALVVVVVILAVTVWPGVLSWLNSKRLKKSFEHEMKPNSGASMRDAIDKVNKTLEKVVESQETHGEQISKIAETQKLHGDEIRIQGDKIARLEQVVERRGKLRRRRLWD